MIGDKHASAVIRDVFDTLDVDSEVVVVQAVEDVPHHLRNHRIEPYYTVMRLPEQEHAEYILMLPFTPARKDNLAAWLVAAGLEKARGWQKFRRGRDALPEIRTDLRIEEIGPAHGEAFARIVCDAFDLGDAGVPLLSRLPEIPGWHVFMSFEGDAPAGAGALFIDGDLAWTDFGATAPAFRQRGSQGAILAHRVAFALEAGCREVLTCTGEDVPGDPQHSYRNIRKVGFREDYIRENYAPPRR